MGDLPQDREDGRPPPAATGERASDLLEHFLGSFPGRRIRLGDLVAAMGPRAFGLMLLVLSLPNMLPIPGISTVFGMPLILFGAQMVLGYPRPWMPRRLAALELDREQMSGLLARASPHLRRAERWLRPRASRLAGLWAERAVGLVTLVLGVILILPLFGGNFLPALAISVMALGLVERDGVFVAAGLATAAVALAVVAAVLAAFALGGMAAFGWIRDLMLPVREILPEGLPLPLPDPGESVFDHF